MGCRLPLPARIVLIVAVMPTTMCRGWDCLNTYGIFNECIGYSGSGTSECEACVATYYSNVLRLNLTDIYDIPCVQIDYETCDAISSCASSCSGCVQEFITFFECESLCSLDDYNCPNADSTSSSPTSSPTAECPDEKAAFVACTEQNGAYDDCVTCVNANIPDEIETCQYVEHLTCTMMDECPICGDCEAALVTWNNCLNPDCEEFDCTSVANRPSAAPAASTSQPTLPFSSRPPSSAACRSSEDALDTCMFDSLSETQSANCQMCVEAKFDQLLGQETSTKCSTIQSELCDAIYETCDCGACENAYLELAKCLVDKGDSGCNLMCDGLGDSTQTAAGASSGVRPSLAIPSCFFLLLLVAI